MLLPSPEFYTVGWIAALPIERAAAIALFDERHEEPEGFEQHPSDYNSYAWGRMGVHNIVIASLPSGQIGTTPSATTASNLLASLPHIRIGLLVGIGGGVARPDQDVDIRLGDVVVGQPVGTTGGVIQYDLGKVKQNQVWERKGSLNCPPQVLLHALSTLQAEHEIASSKIPVLLDKMWESNPLMKVPKTKNKPAYIHQGLDNDRLFKQNYHHVGGDTCIQCDASCEIQRSPRDSLEPEIHYGLIASGNTLVKDPEVRDAIAKNCGEQCLCLEMEAAGLMNHFPCMVIRGISDYADSHKNDRWQRYASATAAAYAKELLEYIPAKKLEATQKALDVLKSMGEGLKTIQSTTEHTNKEIHKLQSTIVSLDQRTVLERLPLAHGAAFDSHENEDDPRCLLGTRRELLEEIQRWATDPSREHIYWLQGKAGTGKSTIARTIASHLSENLQLAASFFFKRGAGDRGGARRFVPTIAVQLAQHVPTTARHIRSAIERTPNIADKALAEQFKQLILTPLQKIQDTKSSMIMIVVIDALDECSGDEDVKRIVYQLSRADILTQVQVKFFVTSRFEPPVRLGFNNINNQYIELPLHQIPKSQIERDITAFLGWELEKIRRRFKIPPVWPRQQQIDRLACISAPLFIFASTACRFVGENRLRGGPKDRLEQFLQYQTISSDLGAAYRPVLGQMLGCSGERELIEDFKQIVGSIILLSDPLSATSLGKLLQVPTDDIDRVLFYLHSVLDIPTDKFTPIRPFHQSFRDYLLDPESDAKAFQIEESHTHQILAGKCIQLLSRDGTLKQDICDLRHPGVERKNVKTLHIDKCLPEEVQYACLYWVQHIKKSRIRLHDGHQVLHFLRRHFLHWAEALSLIGRISQLIEYIKDLQGLIDPSNSVDIGRFLYDMRRFTLLHRQIIDSTPLQLYSSLLIFLPEQNELRTWFKSEVAPWVAVKAEVQDDWSQCLMTLGDIFNFENDSSLESRPIFGHNPCSVAFSHDSTFMVSRHGDGSCHLWDVGTGKFLQRLEPLVDASFEACYVAILSHDSTLVALNSGNHVEIWDVKACRCIRVLEGHEDPILSIAFSHDSTSLASSSRDHTVRIWDINNSSHSQVLASHESSVRHVAFSHDSVLLASATRKILRIWDTKTYQCIKTLNFQNYDILSLDFSRNLPLLALTSIEQIKVWNINDWEHPQIFKVTGFGSSAAFSNDSSRIISASTDGKIHIWDFETRQRLHTIQSGDDIQGTAISHDSKFIAVVARDSIRIWDISPREYSEHFEHIDRAINYIAVSPLSRQHIQLIASGFADNTVRIWCADTVECLRILEGHSGQIFCVTFSHDSLLVASGSDDGTVRIWCADTGECLQVLNAAISYFSIFYGLHHQSMVFSHDSSLIAAICKDGIVKIFRVDTGTCLQTIKGPKVENHICLAFSPDSSLFASHSQTRGVEEVIVWHTSTGICLQTFTTFSTMSMPEPNNAVVFSHDSALVASGSSFMVHIWHINRGECLYAFQGRGYRINSIAFSIDSSLIALEYCDGTTDIHNVDSGKRLDLPSNCFYLLQSAAFSKNPVYNISVQQVIERQFPLNTSKNNPPPSGQSKITWEGSFCAHSNETCNARSEYISQHLAKERSLEVLSKEKRVKSFGFGYELSDDWWIFYNGRPILWLPKDYRAISGKDLIGLTDGFVWKTTLKKLLIIRFFPDKFPASIIKAQGVSL